jgi:hypothetical protein
MSDSYKESKKTSLAQLIDEGGLFYDRLQEAVREDFTFIAGGKQSLLKDPALPSVMPSNINHN